MITFDNVNKYYGDYHALSGINEHVAKGEVLVVDDHPANRLLMCQQLGYLGHQFTAAQNGAAGHTSQPRKIKS